MPLLSPLPVLNCHVLTSSSSSCRNLPGLAFRKWPIQRAPADPISKLASLTFGSICIRYLSFGDFLSFAFSSFCFSKLRELCFWYVISLHRCSTFLFLEFHEDLENRSRTLATATFTKSMLLRPRFRGHRCCKCCCG